MDHPEYSDQSQHNATTAIPWAVVITAAAAEVGKYIAGRVLSSVLSDGPLSRSEMVEIIAAAVAEIKQHISREITQQTINEVQGRIAGCLNLLNQYSNSPSLPHRLFEADTEAQHAISTLEIIGAPALTTYIYAVNVKLLCIAALYKSSQSTGELKNFERTYASAIEFADKNIREIAASLNQRITNVSEITISSTTIRFGQGDMGGSITTWTAVFWDNGRKVSSEGRSSSDAMADATKRRLQAITYYTQSAESFQKSVVLPVRTTIEHWGAAFRTLVNSSYQQG